MYKTLDKIKETNEVSSLYIVYMDPETMTCVILLMQIIQRADALPEPGTLSMSRIMRL